MILDDVKTALRISHNSLDGDISDLIESARSDLLISGISSGKLQMDIEVDFLVDVDPLIKRAIIIYCKFQNESDNAKAERFQKSYDMLKTHLSLAGDYQEVSSV